MSNDASGPVDPVLAFYDGSGTDRDGRTLQDVRELDHYELEADHRFIAWLFPIPEKSSFGYFTPRISAEGVLNFRSSTELQDRLRDSFRFILDFYGLRLVERDELEVVEASTFQHRARVWITEGNHNFLRLSRVLRCLEHLGLKSEAEALLRYLEDLYLRRSEVIGERTLRYWRMRASGSGEDLWGE